MFKPPPSTTFTPASSTKRRIQIQDKLMVMMKSKLNSAEKQRLELENTYSTTCAELACTKAQSDNMAESYESLSKHALELEVRKQYDLPLLTSWQSHDARRSSSWAADRLRQREWAFPQDFTVHWQTTNIWHRMSCRTSCRALRMMRTTRHYSFRVASMS